MFINTFANLDQYICICILTVNIKIQANLSEAKSPVFIVAVQII